MFTFLIDRDRADTLPDQIAGEIERLVLEGTLGAGIRLPSSRDLAKTLGVGRNAVVAAYERLAASGFVTSATGRGTFVMDRPSSTPPAGAGTARDRATGEGATRRGAMGEGARGEGAALGNAARDLSPGRTFSWVRYVARECPPPAAEITAALARDPAVIHFEGAVPDPATFPAEEIRKILQEVLRREGAAALGYGPTAGYPPLRSFLAERASREGPLVKPEDVLIVGGSQQGLDLVARLFLAPGDVVLVEAPTYSNALQIWKLYGADVVAVPMDGRGIVPDALRSALRATRPKLLYVMPTFQNPTGLTMDVSRRREVMAIAAEFEVPVLEDHFDTDLRYLGLALPPLRAFDAAGQVILLGTFSKILFPGFRLGWIISPPEVRQRLLAIKRTCDLSTSLPAQMVVAEFCLRGHLDRHLERVRRRQAARLVAMQESIARHFPGSAGVTRPEGGMTLWVTLPEGSDSEAILDQARVQNVIFAPGTWFFPDGAGRRHLRLSFVTEPAERIERGIEILGRILTTQLARRSATPDREEEPAPFL